MFKTNATVTLLNSPAHFAQVEVVVVTDEGTVTLLVQGTEVGPEHFTGLSVLDALDAHNVVKARTAPETVSADLLADVLADFADVLTVTEKRAMRTAMLA